MKQKGFTLIELLVVISIIAILSTIGIAIYQGVQAKARDSIRKNDLIKLGAALEIYAQQNNGSYIPPADPNVNAYADCARGDIRNLYTTLGVDSVPKDPNGTDYCYIAVDGGKSYRLFAKLENCSGSAGNLCSSTEFNYSITSPDLNIAAAPPTSGYFDVVPTPASTSSPTPTSTSSPLIPIISNLSANLQNYYASFSFNASNFSFSSVYAANYTVNISTSPTMSAADTYLNFAQGPYNTFSITDPNKWSSYSCGTTVYWRIYTSDGTNTVTSPIKQDTVTCAPPPTPDPTLRRVFVTSSTYTGNLGGLTGADSKCQTSASTAGVTGTWKAWLSDNTTSASSRLEHFTGPYKLVNGTTVANSWTDLTDGSLLNPINVSEFGNDITTRTSVPALRALNYVWTNTQSSGNVYSTDSTSACNNWGDLSSISYYSGAVGNLASGSNWTFSSTDYCSQSFHLYCFEQPTP